MESNKLIRALGKKFPKSLKEDFDRVGKMVGSKKIETKRILLCLDFDETIISFVTSFKPDLIITHHPFIFGTLGKVLAHDEIKRNLVNLLRDEFDDIAIYSYHTNFDSAYGGMNDALAQALELKNIVPAVSNQMMRIGDLPNSLPVEEFCQYALNKLGIEYGSLLQYGKKTVSKIAIIGGGGARDYFQAQNEGADIYLSGDCPHHVRRDIILAKFNYFDIPHEVEKIFMPTMNDVLLSIDPTLEILIVDHEVPGKIIKI